MVDDGNRVWATLLTGDAYLPGVRVLRQSLREAGTAYDLVVMVTAGVSRRTRERLGEDGCVVRAVERVDPPASSRHEGRYIFEQFSEVWTKLRAWDLPFERVVLLDADMLVTRPLDDLMTMPLPDGGVAACHTCRCNPERHRDYPADWVPDSCWFTYWTGSRPLPHDFVPYFNSGLVVLRPDPALFSALVARVADGDPSRFAFPDQDLLNEHFRQRWAPLPMGLNALKTLPRQHPDVWEGDPTSPVVRNIHYLLAKPWVTDGPPSDPAYAILDRHWHDVAARVPS